MPPSGRPGLLSSVQARLAASREVAVTRLLPGTVYAMRTPGHDRLVRVAESEMRQADRQVTVRCPGCSAIWQASVHAPVIHWQQ